MKNKKTIQIEGKSESEIQNILEKLRKNARVKNAKKVPFPPAEVLARINLALI